MPATTGGYGYVGPVEVYDALIEAEVDQHTALILTAIGGAESGWNTDALTDDAADGDYAVGVWQINYYGPDFVPRSEQFGPPLQLLGNLKAQAQAAAMIYDEQGLEAWSTYTNGTYGNYLQQASTATANPLLQAYYSTSQS